MKYDNKDCAQGDIDTIEPIKLAVAAMIKVCRGEAMNSAAEDVRRLADNLASDCEGIFDDDLGLILHSAKEYLIEAADDAPDDASMRAWDNGRKL